MKNATTGKPSETDWARVDALTDEDIVKAMTADPDAFPYDPRDEAAVDAFWKDAVVVREGGPKAVREALDARRRERAEAAAKEHVPLDRDVVSHFQTRGDNWHARINEALREWIAEHEPEGETR